MALPPLNRPYNFNFPLFDALERAPDVDRSSIWLFTAYDATGVGLPGVVLRCELLDWIAEAHPSLQVVGVATVMDPAFGHGPGAYYRSVIEPAERALLRKQADVDGKDDLVTLLHDEEIETLSSDDWCTPILMTYGEILRQEAKLIKQWHFQATGGQSLAGKHSTGGAPRLDKEQLARLCLLSSESFVAASAGASAEGTAEVSGEALPRARSDCRVLFLDDRLAYIEQVRRACEDLGADLFAVHVTRDMRDAGAFLRQMSPVGCRSGCTVS